MKKTTIKWLIGIALFSIQTAAYSQNFIDETKQWAIVTQPMDLNTHFTTYSKFSGDTIINGNAYHKLYSSTDSNQVNWTIGSYWWERNDSVFLRCQHYGNFNDTTILLYDFNLVEGDTFKINEGESMKVDSIRYIEFGDSIRKYWFFNRGSTYGNIIWIEGVGEWGNFACPVDMMSSSSSQLLCFHENGILIYQNPSYTSCYVYTAVPSITKSQGLINVSPNPATHYLTLKVNNFELSTLNFQLYDMQGTPQLTGKTSNTQTELNVATLPRGLYVLKVITEKQTVTKKVVLQ